ncbi:hypothetical protein [Pseudomonas fluorescens]|uniref:hypothetical protein n=1 Tax=Pseudomonas fluorescens TaxID=294 RepID=UPI00123F33B2|nr:hypothetical protein [Pseudomonas fluorescens]VVM99020.1 hypothetical protein PS639_03185 [Pseudomonas fluorescens]
MSKQVAVTTIANKAVDQLQVAREYMAWFDSLSWAISSSLQKGHAHHAKQLAGVAQFLAGDYHNLLDHEVKSLNDELNALDVRG